MNYYFKGLIFPNPGHKHGETCKLKKKFFIQNLILHAKSNYQTSLIV